MALDAGEHVLAKGKEDSRLLRHYVVLSGPVDHICQWYLFPSRNVCKVDFSESNVLEIHLHKAGKVPHSKIFKRD